MDQPQQIQIQVEPLEPLMVHDESPVVQIGIGTAILVIAGLILGLGKRYWRPSK